MSATSKRSNKNKYMLAAAALAAGLLAGGIGPAVYAVDSFQQPLSLHAAMTREALGGTFADANLKALIAANESQDTPGSEGRTEKRRHFDGNDVFPAALAYINREKTRALNLAVEADTDAQSRADTLRHLGLMLHSVQDFYLHTNYVEIAMETEKNHSDPYNTPLVDWSRVPDGYVGAKSSCRLAACSAVDTADAINKEGDTTHGGKVSLGGGVTQYKVARDLAIRETQRQWNLFETLVRNKLGTRATAVLTALKQADPKAPDEK